MLKIRPEQMDAFSSTMRQQFEQRLTAHLQRCFPAQCRALGENRLAELVKDGTQRAARYQFIAEQDVCKFLDIIMVFGPSFDTDLELDWVAPVLNSEREPEEKISTLFDAAVSHTEKNGEPEPWYT